MSGFDMSGAWFDFRPLFWIGGAYLVVMAAAVLRQIAGALKR